MAKELIKPGEVKNPRGRPKGAKGKAKQIVEKLENAVGTPKMLSDLKKVFKKTVEQALDGDVSCQKILWDRFLPVKRFENQGATKSPMININIGETVGEISKEANNDGHTINITEAEIVSETKH